MPCFFFVKKSGPQDWTDTYGIPDELANVAGRGQADEFHRSHPVIALSLGYESESAFNTAFKWVMGCSLQQHSHDRNQASSSNSGAEATRADQREAVAG